MWGEGVRREVFKLKDAHRNCVAADTSALVDTWLRTANTAIRSGINRDTAIQQGNQAVWKSIRRRKRKGRR